MYAMREANLVKTIAIDFDGVLHAYSRGWEDGVIYDDPVPGALDAVRKLAQSYKLVVFTARDELGPVWEWLVQHGFTRHDYKQRLGIESVTNRKPPAAIYIDDRGLRFLDWQQALDGVEIIEAMERMGVTRSWQSLDDFPEDEPLPPEPGT